MSNLWYGTNQLVISLSYIGMGLPYELWGQVFNLIQRNIFKEAYSLTLGYSGTIYNQTMFLDQPCTNTDVQNLLQLAFQIQWQNTSNVTYFPLGAFAMANPSNSSQCLLMIQNFVQTTANVAMNSTIVLGSMFLQQYTAWWRTNYSSNVTTLSLQIASNNTLTNSYISSKAWNNALSDPFFIETD